MKVIVIKEDVKIGKFAQTVEVKDGYARNFLIPHGIALAATKENIKKLDQIRRQKRKSEDGLKQECFELKHEIEKISLTVTAEAKEDEEIYGSLQEAQILKLLRDEGIELGKGKMDLKEPIRKLGVYNIRVQLHPEVEASLRVWVVKK
ncbi:MAG: 50S ribosomal protein L9 [Candidatus Omnitrophota bacterium]